MVREQDTIAGYQTCAVMRIIFRQEGLGDMSKATYWRWLQREHIPCKRAGNMLLVPALLALEIRKRELAAQ